MRAYLMNPLRRVFPIFFVVFFGYVGYSLIITIFTPLLLNEKDQLLSPEVSDEIRILSLGFLLACYPFGQFLSSPILGALSDRFGRRPILIYSLIITTLIYLLVVLGIEINNYFVVAVALLISGLSEGNTALSQSVIADVVEEKERSPFFGYVYFSVAVAFIIGPILGGKLADPNLVSWFSYKTPFIFVAILVFGTFLWFCFGFKETHPLHHREKVPYFEAFTNLKHIFFTPHLRPYFLANFLIFLGIFGFFQGFPIYVVDRFKLNVTHLGIFIAWTSVPFLIVNLWLIKPLVKRFTPIQLVIFSGFWIGIFVLIGLIPNKVWPLWITLFLIGSGIALCLPSCSAMLSRLAKEKEQGRVLGNNLSLQYFSEALVGILIGLLASLFLKLTIIFFAFLSIAGSLLLFVAQRKPLR